MCWLIISGYLAGGNVPRQSQACKFQPGYKWGPKMRTKSLFSLIREVGGKSARPTLLKAPQNVADHILPLTFTITLCVKENNKSCFLLWWKTRGKRRHNLGREPPHPQSCFEKKLSCPLLKYQSNLAALTHVCHTIN